MTNWLMTVDLTDIWHVDDYTSLAPFLEEIIRRLKGLRFTRKAKIDIAKIFPGKTAAVFEKQVFDQRDIFINELNLLLKKCIGDEEYSESESSRHEFDKIFERMYDWGDTRPAFRTSLCWIST